MLLYEVKMLSHVYSGIEQKQPRMRQATNTHTQKKESLHTFERR